MLFAHCKLSLTDNKFSIFDKWTFDVYIEYFVTFNNKYPMFPIVEDISQRKVYRGGSNPFCSGRLNNTISSLYRQDKKQIKILATIYIGPINKYVYVLIYIIINKAFINNNRVLFNHGYGSCCCYIHQLIMPLYAFFFVM